MMLKVDRASIDFSLGFVPVKFRDCGKAVDRTWHEIRSETS